MCVFLGVLHVYNMCNYTMYYTCISTCVGYQCSQKHVRHGTFKTNLEYVHCSSSNGRSIWPIYSPLDTLKLDEINHFCDEQCWKNKSSPLLTCKLSISALLPMCEIITTREIPCWMKLYRGSHFCQYLLNKTMFLL